MIPIPPKGQGPIDPQSAFVPPPLPDGQTPAAQAPTSGPAFHPAQNAGGANRGYPGGGGWGPPPGWPMMPPPRRGLWRILTTLFLVLLLGGSFLLNLMLLARASGAGGSTAVTQTLQEGDPKQTVAVIEVAGAIDGNTSARFSRLMDEIERDADVRALVIEVDTPGGEVTASDEIHARILRYKASRASAGKPAGVVISMRSSATSGGYYIACAGDWIFAEQTTITGNIGVLLASYNVSELMAQHGIKETTVVASGADFKHLGSPFQPETEQGRAYFQVLVDDAFGRFKQVVTTGRGAKISGKDIFNGKIFTASQAHQLGLVDQIGYPVDAYAYAATSVGSLNRPHVVRYREPSPGLLGMLLGGVEASATGQAATPAQPLDLSALARPETLDAWRGGRLLYR